MQIKRAAEFFRFGQKRQALGLDFSAISHCRIVPDSLFSGRGFDHFQPLADDISPDVVTGHIARRFEHVKQGIDPERERDDRGGLFGRQFQTIQHHEQQENAAAGNAARANRSENHAVSSSS